VTDPERIGKIAGEMAEIFEFTDAVIEEHGKAEP